MSEEQKKKNKSMIAWAFYDWAHSAFSTVILTFIFAAYFIHQVAPDAESGTMYWGTTIGIVGIFVALLGPFLGAIADQKGGLKTWLAIFTGICAGATASLWFIKSGAYLWLALIFVGIGTLGSQLAMIFYNSMLSNLVPPKERRLWSGWGWGLGYFGGLICLVLIWFLFISPNAFLNLDTNTGMPVRVACLFTACWLIIFALPILLMTFDKKNTGKSLQSSVYDGLNQLRESFRNIRQYKNLVKFFIAYMLYIDALNAVFVMGGLFAAGTIGMDERQIVLFGITLNITGGIGAFGFAWVDKYFGSKLTILFSLICLIISAIIMLFVVKTLHLFWFFGLLFGIFVGPVQAASRSYISQAVPAKLQTQVFGLYALSGKATAFAAPLLVGWLTYFSSSQRIGMSSLIVLFIMGFLILLTVPKTNE